MNAVNVLLIEHPTPWKIRRDRSSFTGGQFEEVIYDRNGSVVCTAPDYATAALIANAVEVWADE